MECQTENKILLVTRETRLDELVARYNTLSQAQFYIEHLGADFSDYTMEDRQYKSAITSTETILRKYGRVQVLHRRFLPNFVFGKNDIIVVLGQDGLVANTIKYLDNHLVVGVNPDPLRWDGMLLPFQVSDLKTIIPDVFAGRRNISEITMARAELSDGQLLYAVNDFFIGARSHVSARYSIRANGMEEEHSSSGIIVSTGLGSTGWLKSVLAGATAIAGAASGQTIETPTAEIPWNADYLYFSVREPFPSRTTSASVVFGKISASSPMTLLSRMAGTGVIFSDGIEKDFLEFNSGITAEIKVAEKHGHLVM